jgi:hypothetical protein
MSDRRPFGKTAAIGALLAALVVLAGGSPARADELADLRANNDLLQQRVDQARQTAADPGAAPNAPLSTGSFPRSFLVPGTDTSIRIGGSVTGIVQYGRQ